MLAATLETSLTEREAKAIIPDTPTVAKREPFFECVLVADRNEYRFHLRAWTAEEAELHFRAALAANGVTASGELQVLDPRGRIARRSAYAPDAGGVRA